MSAWDKLIDQNAVKSRLFAYLNNSKHIANSWVFTGPPGSGRTLAVNAFICQIVCETQTACGECHKCLSVINNSQSDLNFLSTQELIIKIDVIRRFVSDFSQLPPQNLEYRFLIIEDADRMDERSQDTLLKSIEEPNERIIWIFTTNSRLDLMPTVISRSVIINLKSPSSKAICDYLIENYQLDEAKANEIAHISNNHLGLAKRYISNPHELEDRKYNASLAVKVHTIYNALEFASELIKKSEDYSAKHCQAQNNHSLYLDDNKATSERIKKRISYDYLDIALQAILTVYRDISIMQHSNSTENIINQNFIEKINNFSKSLTLKEVKMRIDIISDARERLKSNANPLIILEAMFAQLLLPKRVFQQ